MQAKEFLSRKGVPFEYVDVTQLADPAATLRAITGGPVATPTIVIGDAWQVGFDPEWIERQLGEAGP